MHGSRQSDFFSFFFCCSLNGLSWERGTACSVVYLPLHEYRAYISHFCLQDSEKYVEELLTLFNRFSKLVKEAFNDDPRFLTARDKVCQSEMLFLRKKPFGTTDFSWSKFPVKNRKFCYPSNKMIDCRLCSVIVRVRVVLKRTVVGDSD